MSTLIVIPARLGATRLPRKPLRLLGGVPLVVRVWERVCSHRLGDHVVVATDDAEVADAVRAAGAECVLTSPAHPSGTDRVAEVAGRKEFSRYEVIVNAQGDEPFLPDAALRGAASLVTSGRFPLGTAAAPASPGALTSPHVVKVVTDDAARAMYFSRAAIPFLRDAGDETIRDGVARQHLGVYAYTRDALARWVGLPRHALERVEGLEQLRPLAAGMAMGVAVVDDSGSRGIDTEDDLAEANVRWANLLTGSV